MESVIELEQLTSVVCQAIANNKGTNIAILDVEEVSPVGERLVLCTASATRQVRAIADSILLTLKKEHNKLPYGVEGRGVDVWVLLDYGSLVVHIFQPETREYYDLDGLWMEAPRLPLEDFGIEEQAVVEEDSEEESSSWE
jgi:ribosome-associated protein